MLDNPETAEYTHTLTVTGKDSGLYMCSVANNKPSHDSASILCIGKRYDRIELYNNYLLNKVPQSSLKLKLEREKLYSPGLHPLLPSRTPEPLLTTLSPVLPLPPLSPRLTPSWAQSQWLGFHPTLSTSVHCWLLTHVLQAHLLSQTSPHCKIVMKSFMHDAKQ